MIDFVSNLAEHIGHWGYLVVFVLIVLECQPLLGLFIPGESLVLLTGLLAGQEVFKVNALIITIAAAAIVGDSIAYGFGRHFGKDWLRRHGLRFGVRGQQLDRVESFFQRHGGKSVMFSHFMHFLRVLMPFMAGASGMAYPRFVLFNALGCVLWAALFVLLGYVVGDNWEILEKWIGRAGALIGALALVAAALLWLWQWASQHEAELRAQGSAFLARPRIVALRRRLAPLVRFLQNRLTPEGYMGLNLTIGASIIVLAAWCFGAIAEDVLDADPLVEVDKNLAAWFHRHATGTVTQIAVYITSLASPAFLGIATIAIAMVLLVRRNWYWLLTLALTMGLGAALNLVLKTLFHRARPIFENPIMVLSGYGFPSGHAMGATLFYGIIAIYIGAHLKSWRARMFAFIAAFFMAALIGLTRIYLGVHYLSDVIGAIAAAIAWLALCITAVHTLSERRRTLKQSN